jgi:hypothetical protein
MEGQKITDNKTKKMLKEAFSQRGVVTCAF